MHVHFETTEPGSARIELDGVDITSAVLRRGFAITFDEHDPLGRPHVSLVLRADRLTVDAEAVVDASRAEYADRVAAAIPDPEQEAS